MKISHFLFSAICIFFLARKCQKEPEVVKVESVSLNTASITIVEGESQSLTATVSPSNAGNKKVIWSSSNSSVATVDDRGTVIAITPGVATITAKTEDGGKIATCSVTVNSKTVTVESISLDKTEATLVVGETITLTATVSPADAADKTVTWSSSDESIATVKEGVVTAIRIGAATITAKAGDKTATCAVSVKAEATTNPFTITSVGSTSVSIIRAGFPYNITLEYRKGVGVWSSYPIGFTIDLADGENVQFIAGEGGNANFSGSNSNHYRVVVSGSGKVKVSGNIMSLLDKTGERATVPNYVFNHLFSDCNKLVDASKLELPATTLAESCYSGMFFGCTSLQTASNLPATTLATNCYNNMFYGCTSLQTAPELSATTLASNCYSGMFFGCTSLHAAPKLPATTLASNCYVNMFSGCTSLQAAPELPAIKLASGCYSCMFSGCASLQTAPELPATTLTESCYLSMFTSCTSLQTAPELPATNLDGSCYHAMFMRCSSLQAAPELPATNLAYGCYSYMFSGCTSLQAAPELPAAKLVYECYRSMFSECTSLHATPVLPATNLVERCYDEMFSSCSRLNYVEAMFETTPSDTYTGNWLTGVSSTGTFVKSKNATWNVTGPHGIPEGWTVQIAE